MRSNIVGIFKYEKKTMDEIRRILQRAYYAMLGIISALGFAFAPVGKVFASSVYDNFYQTTSSVVGKSDYVGHTCDPVDVTSSWESYVRDSSKWDGIHDYSSDAASLVSALGNSTYGAWGVSQQENNMSYSMQKNPIIFWTEDSSAHLEWKNNIGNDGVYLVANSASIHYVSVGCLNYVYGNPYANEERLISSGTTSMLEISTADDNAHTNIIKNLFAYNVDTNLPSGYVGASVVTSSNAPSEIMGDILCFNGPVPQVTNVHVTPSAGISGDASLTSDGFGGTHYSYFPAETSSTYQLGITCGAVTQATNPTSLNTGTTNYILYCSVAVDNDCYLEN